MLRFLLLFTVLCVPMAARSQDTLRISLEEFLQRGKAYSDELKAQEYSVDLADNKIREARLLGFLPRFELTTNHGIVPDVRSDSILANGSPLPREEYYLDPNLKNDWSRLKVFTQAEIQMLQPIFAWGAIRSAIEAAEAGALAAREQFLMEEGKVEIRLYELYYARLLSMELSRLLDEASRTFDQAEEQLQKMLDEGDSDIDESEIYRLRIAKQEFLSQAQEVRLNAEFVRNTWNLVLGGETGTVFHPTDDFLTLRADSLAPPKIYEDSAQLRRPEIRALDAAVMAAQAGWKAANAQRLPAVFLGFGAEYVYTPRPVQTQPLFGDRFNYVNIIYSFGIRQNLNFASSSQKAERALLTYRQAQYSRDAAVTGIAVDANDKYKQAALAYSRVETSSQALQTSKEWLTQEQINYDLGLGEIKNLVEAVRTNFELEVRHRQRIFEYNLSIGRLRQAAGQPLAD